MKLRFGDWMAPDQVMQANRVMQAN
jgi:hypothetical protein